MCAANFSINRLTDPATCDASDHFPLAAELEV